MEDELVLALARQLHVVAVMRAVACHHRHEVAGGLEAAVVLLEAVGDREVRDPVTLGKAVGVVLGGMDVGLEVDIGLGGGLHHAGRIHLDGLQVDRADLHAVDHHRVACRVFRGKGQAGSHGQNPGGKGGGGNTVHRASLSRMIQK